ncbi:MAG: hypothetical protein GKR94_13945 [Gammaproteobacteria bacterium]|nr:hypothetical protein [Gammaproteobacteria bacterium]
MTGWQWFWTLIGFIVYIIALIFLYFFKPFEDLFVLVLNGISYQNIIFWVALFVGVIGFCTYHWRAYRIHIIGEHNVEAMVMSSLRGSALTAIILCGGAMLQSVQILCAHMLAVGFSFEDGFGRHLGAVLAMVVLTAVFCVVYWLLKVLRRSHAAMGHGV